MKEAAKLHDQLSAMDKQVLYTAKSGFALVLISLNNLSSLKMACKDEVLMWMEVASTLPDTQLWQAVDHLVELKIVSKKSAEGFGHSFLAANATLRSQAILNAAVIPSGHSLVDEVKECMLSVHAAIYKSGMRLRHLHPYLWRSIWAE